LLDVLVLDVPDRLCAGLWLLPSQDPERHREDIMSSHGTGVQTAERSGPRPMISLQRVTKTYVTPAGDFTALGGIDLELGGGQLVAIVGKSGSGKSTLLNVIGGIDRPSSGSVVVDATALDSLSEAQLATWRGATIGFVFQFFQLLPTLTALENVMLPMDLAGVVPVRQRRTRAQALLERVGIARHAGKFPAGLSGGEQQRVAIVRALANDPKLVLADEPTGNLDSSTAREVFELLRALAADGKTVLVVTHDTEIRRLADRALTIADGELVGAASPAHAAEAV
jgi:ABC-type lipoprotein export system ATPase subunit